MTRWFFGLLFALLLGCSGGDGDAEGGNSALQKPGSGGTGGTGGVAGSGGLPMAGGAGGVAGSGGLPMAGGAGGAQSVDECLAREGGSAGAICVSCAVARVDLSEAVTGDGLRFELETSLGDEFSEFGTIVPNADGLGSLVMTQNGSPGDPVDQITLEGNCGGSLRYSPDWIEARIYRNEVELGAERFTELNYSCRLTDRHHPCWEAAPVTLLVSE